MDGNKSDKKNNKNGEKQFDAPVNSRNSSSLCKTGEITNDQNNATSGTIRKSRQGKKGKQSRRERAQQIFFGGDTDQKLGGSSIKSHKETQTDFVRRAFHINHER